MCIYLLFTSCSDRLASVKSYIYEIEKKISKSGHFSSIFILGRQKYIHTILPSQFKYISNTPWFYFNGVKCQIVKNMCLNLRSK